jgi:hypothetical protein
MSYCKPGLGDPLTPLLVYTAPSGWGICLGCLALPGGHCSLSAGPPLLAHREILIPQGTKLTLPSAACWNCRIPSVLLDPLLATDSLVEGEDVKGRNQVTAGLRQSAQNIPNEHIA